MTTTPPSAPTDEQPLGAAYRTGMETWFRTADVALAANTAAARGFADWLDGTATATKLTVDLTRQTLLAGLHLQSGPIPLAQPVLDPMAEALDEAMAAIESSTADTTRALAADFLDGIETATELTTLQRHVHYAIAIHLFGSRPAPQEGPEPVRIDISPP
ncbi:MAG: hypothetical protein ABEI77_04015 [Halorientalis sp.]